MVPVKLQHRASAPAQGKGSRAHLEVRRALPVDFARARQGERQLAEILEASDWLGSLFGFLAKDTGEDGVHVLEVIAEVEELLEFGV